MTIRGRWGCLIFFAYPLLEIAVAVAVASVIGWWWVFVIVVLSVVLGLGLVRYALGATGRSLGIAMAALRPPGDPATLAIASPQPIPEVTPPAQTLLIVPAGLLIAMPGLITTTMGLIAWLPPVRRLLARRLERAARRIQPPPDMYP